MSKQVALYARVSTRDQDCQLQLADLKAMATARGFEVAGPYVDQGASYRAIAETLGVGKDTIWSELRP